MISEARSSSQMLQVPPLKLPDPVPNPISTPIPVYFRYTGAQVQARSNKSREKCGQRRKRGYYSIVPFKLHEEALVQLKISEADLTGFIIYGLEGSAEAFRFTCKEIRSQHLQIPIYEPICCPSYWSHCGKLHFCKSLLEIDNYLYVVKSCSPLPAFLGNQKHTSSRTLQNC